MNYVLISTVLFLHVLITQTTANADCNNIETNKYYSFSGDVYVVGFFDAHYGENCTDQNSHSLQQMYDVAAVVRVLNKIKYVPGISIGLSLYDTCTSKEMAIKSFISSLVDADCNFTYNLGALSTSSAASMIRNITDVKNIPIFSLDFNPDTNILLEITAKLLLELEFYNIDLVIFPSAELLDRFNNVTMNKNICVKESKLFSHYQGSCPGNNEIVVVAITSSEMSFLLKLEMDCLSTFVIIILENDIDLSSITENLLLHNVYLVIPSTIWPEFDISVEDNFESIVSLIEENLLHSNVTMSFIRTASTVISVVDHFKTKLLAECAENATHQTLCSNLTNFKKLDENLVLHQTQNVSDLLGVDDRNVLHFLILLINFNHVESFAKVRIVGNELSIDFATPTTHLGVNICDSDIENCKNCSNFIDYFNANISDMNFTQMSNAVECVPLRFRSNGWVSSVLTVCIIGLISCFCVLAFIIMRIYKEDILEGNPCSTFLLIVATVLTYLTVIPFCVELSERKALCAVKLFSSSFCYCTIFSIILSRVLMILTCDYNGSFMSHINGYLQSFLCFFMFAVQVALIMEFWIFGWVLSDVDYCAKFMNTNLFLSYMMYDTFLLILIASLVPFITKSRRNYKEGLTFTVLTVCFIIIWISWSFAYLVASPEWKDFCVATGLTATATAIVVCIFIPRTYLIVTGIVRDRITSAIPTTVSNIVDMNYRSTQALYDSVDLERQKRGELNMGYYDDPNGSSSTSRLEVSVPPARRKSIMSIRSQSMENNYESCDIPDCNQKITKF
ncbi:protein bride of sevenless [Planococcus citri]|uniref:protein bride of sevenless n=1 Tax=Planococcus citri TaxID=170843 RepID=UPI0031F97ED9